MRVNMNVHRVLSGRRGSVAPLPRSCYFREILTAAIVRENGRNFFADADLPDTG